MHISLVTYTHNDHAFVEELLRQTSSWGIPLAETLVVDDASATPFPERGGVRVLRLPENRGPGQAKRIGLAAATGDIVLSLDADIRLSKPWLRSALRHLADPGVGIVGATVLPALADTCLSRALYGMARLEKRAKKDVEVPFLPGGVWLFRRETWEKTGGLAGYDAPTHEDYHLSRKLREHGLRLIMADSHAVYEKRRLTRLAYCRRQAFYYAPVVAAMAAREGLAFVLADLRAGLSPALTFAAGGKEAAILYIELLRVTYLLAQAAGIRPEIFRDARPEAFVSGREATPPGAPRVRTGFNPVAAAALAFVQDFPKVLALLRDDLTRLGLSETSPAPAPPLAECFAPLRASGLFPLLEAIWVDKLREEDATIDFDAHYLDERLHD